MTHLLLVVLLAGFALAGLVLVVVGGRGRRVSEHQHCRKCRFNLYGLGEGRACPECGADVTRAEGVTQGLRERRRGLVVTGLAMVIGPAVVVGLVLGPQAGREAVYGQMPSGVLHWVIDDQLAFAELAERVVSGQANERTRERVERHVQGWDWELRMRDRVQRGREAYALIGLDGSSLRLVFADLEMRVDGQVVARRYATVATPGARTSYLRVEGLTEELGVREVEAELDVRIHYIGGRMLSSELLVSGVSATARVEVVDEPTGDYVQGLDLNEQAARGHIWIERDSTGEGQHLVVAMEVDRGDLAWYFMDVWLIVGEQAINARGLHVRLNESAGRGSEGVSRYRKWRLAHYPVLEEAERVDVVLRPNIERIEIETRMSVERVWLGELIFEGVPLDAEPRDYRLPSDEYRTLVPARARELTVEEAEREPEVEWR